MAKKKATKALSVEAMLEKGVGGLNADLADIQTQTREVLGTIGEALVGKMDTLTGLMDEIKEKKAELGDLCSKEVLAQSISELEEELEDKKRAHGRAMTQLQEVIEDRRQQAEKSLHDMKQEVTREVQEAARVRQRELEDEDRDRKLEQDETDRQLQRRLEDLQKMEYDKETFDTRVKAEVERRAGAIKRDLEVGYMQKVSGLQSDVKVLAAQSGALENDKTELRNTINKLETALAQSQERAAAIATSALDKDAGKAALDELRSVAHKQAESKK